VERGWSLGGYFLLNGSRKQSRQAFSSVAAFGNTSTSPLRWALTGKKGAHKQETATILFPDDAQGWQIEPKRKDTFKSYQAGEA